QNLGNIVTYIVSGVLCANGFDNGWGSIFYITGGIVFFWVLAWFLLVSDSPELHPTISVAERNYIIKGRGNTSHRDIVVPWLAIAKSRAMWMCLMAHIGNNYLNYTLVTGLPSFMNEVLKFDIKQNGLMTAIPYMVMTVTMITAGYAADFIRSRYLSTTYTRRLFQATSFLGAGACLVGVGFVDCENRVIAVVLLAVAVGFEGLCFAGYMVNQVDFAPRFAGVLMGITNMIATVPGILAPTIIGALTPNKTQDEWRNVFYICAGMCLFGAIFFGLFAKGELEPWAAMPEEITVTADDQKKPRSEHSLGQANEAFSTSDEILSQNDKRTTDPMWSRL
ncbi:unnamed protein product, partial [Candidula unifasciata]